MQPISYYTVQSIARVAVGDFSFIYLTGLGWTERRTYLVGSGRNTLADLAARFAVTTTNQ